MNLAGSCSLHAFLPFRVPRSTFLVSRLCFILLSLSSTALAQGPSSSPLALPEDPERAARLKAHGIAPEALLLANFLDNGFAPRTRPADLPATPTVKSQLVVDAIIEASRLHAREATPALGRLARGIPSNGIRAILEWDLAPLRPGERAAAEAQTLKKLRLNAIVALGLIGDADRGYELGAVMRLEQDPELKLPCALAQATLGWPSSLPYLIAEVGRANRTTSPAAGEALRLIAGLDYGPDADAPVNRRREAAAKWKAWWRTEKSTFRPNRNQILERRLTPPPPRRPRAPATVRDLLDCIAYPNDARWIMDSYEAYTQLLAKGPGALDDLAKIVADKNENLRVRREAIRVYTQLVTAARAGGPPDSSAARRAYDTVWWLRWDKNPEIVQAAKQCLPRLKKAKQSS